MGKDFDVIKLKGSENFHTWKFAITNLIDFQGLSEALVCAKPTEPNTAKMEDASKLAKAKAIISLSVETHIYAHIQSAKSALEIWNILKNLYEDRGLSRRITLLRELISIRLDDCDGMNDYIDKIKSTSNKLIGIGFDLNSEWLGAIMLAGLTDEFKPLIMSIEANNEKITSDLITSKLLDMQSSDKTSAFFNKKSKKKSLKPKKCYSCGSLTHLSNKCDKKGNKSTDDKGEKSEKKFESKKKAAFVALMCRENEPNDDWYIDSGTGKHMTRSDNGMCNVSSSNVTEIMSADRGKMKVNKRGQMKIELKDTSIEVDEVLHVPSIAVNLLSVYQICRKGNTICFDENGCTIKNANNEVIVFCKATNGVYKIGKQTERCMYTADNETNALTWHRRMGHMNLRTMQKMKTSETGINYKNGERLVLNCEVCSRGKSCRLPFKVSVTRSKEILGLIHSDLMGPMETKSIGHKRYCLTLIDDYSRKVFVRFLAQKSEVFEQFKEFKCLFEKQTGKTIKVLRTDNGGEYVTTQLENYLRDNGIQHQLTAAYTPEQNGVAERMNRTLVEKARCMLFDAELPKTYWAEAVNMAAYIINRSFCAILGKTTPNEVFYKEKVNVAELKVFGSSVMVHVPKQKRRKWDAKAEKMIFVGYDSDTKGFRCINAETRKLTISRDVKFLEDIPESTLNVELDEESDASEEVDENNEYVDDRNETLTSDDELNKTMVEIENASVRDQSSPMNESGGVLEITADDRINDPDYNSRAKTGENIEARASTRPRKQHQPFQIGYSNWVAFFAPTTVDQAINGENGEKWNAAMDDEIKSHKLNKTWDLCDLPTGRKSIKSKWVFKLKENGGEKRFKARLVAKGYSQKFGIDYEETFSPVVRTTTLRIMFALSVEWDMQIHQMDAITAFLQGDLHEEVYMDQPERYEDGTRRVCKLNKAIYGLKQAGRQWNIKLSVSLIEFGLKKSQLDPCVFYGESLIVLIYVDDMLIFYKAERDLNDIRDHMFKHFHMKDIGAATECIGMRISREKGQIQIDQEKYVDEILQKFDMLDCKTSKTPSDPSIKLSITMIREDNDITGRVPYQELVGTLLYLSQGTRPDIAFAVSDVSRFNSKHSDEHWNAVLRIVRYLKATKSLRLCYKKENNGNELHAYSDADWGSDVDKRRSCTGFVINLNHGAINWKSQRQSIVALSSTEAEYVALSSTVKDVLWIQQIINELKQETISNTTIYGDNMSSIKIGEVEAYRERTKHIDIRHHHIRQQIALHKIRLRHVSTNDNAADLLTKAISGEKTQACAKTMGMK